MLVFIRTGIGGEFKISYSKLGPTEMRVFAIFLNTAMYFGGVRTVVELGTNGQIALTPYDLFLGMVGVLLLSFFIGTAARETMRLAKDNQ